jgi:dihydropteroate synthase
LPSPHESRPAVQIMGILNVTPDSFSDGGRHADPVAAGRALLDAGADIIDIGGESTRPGARPVPPEEEQARILPVIEALAGTGARVSVDTRNAATMRAALDAGAGMINDVSALAHDPGAAGFLATRTCPVILMHMRGTPQTMAGLAVYADVADEVAGELGARVDAAEQAGIARSRLILDPGLGFAKTPAHSLAILRNLPVLEALGLPLLIGASRKAFVGHFGLEPDPARRLPGSLAVALFAAARNVAYLRVHDVAETRQALRVWRELTV